MPLLCPLITSAEYLPQMLRLSFLEKTLYVQQLSPLSLRYSVLPRSRPASDHIMEFDNATVQEDVARGFALETLLEDHHGALFIVCLSSLIFGVPLAWNVLWHLKERVSDSGQTYAMP